MKKIFFVLVMCLMFCVNANAQWDIYGTKYNTDKGSCTIFNEISSLNVISSTTSFKNELHGNNKIVNVTIGYYNVNGRLLNIDEVQFITRNTKIAVLFNNKEIYNKIINHLKNEGNVRFTAKRENDYDFDLTVTMNENILFNVDKK